MRLKGNRSCSVNALASMFQFQTGAIKRAMATRGLICYFEFQFQTGAIKSDKVEEDKDSALFGFNSKLVRLKVKSAIPSVIGVQFQFQTGAIKRQTLRR